jgi:hypothetical protein
MISAISAAKKEQIVKSALSLMKEEEKTRK